MKIPSVICILLFILQMSGFSQNYGTVQGVVYDSTEKEVIPYVHIRIIETGQNASSDAEGKFRLDKVPAGEHTLQCLFVGYSTQSKYIRIIEDSTIHVKINMAVCEHDQLGGGDCPECKRSDQVIPIVYGKPSRKTLKKAEKGKVFLGGCIIQKCQPHWYCKRDSIRF